MKPLDLVATNLASETGRQAINSFVNGNRLFSYLCNVKLYVILRTNEWQNPGNVQRGPGPRYPHRFRKVEFHESKLLIHISNIAYIINWPPSMNLQWNLTITVSSLYFKASWAKAIDFRSVRNSRQALCWATTSSELQNNACKEVPSMITESFLYVNID